MEILMIEQGSPEWIQARLGSLGASRLSDALAKTKSGYSTSRENLLVDIAVERLTGEPTECYVSAAMEWGVSNEADAREVYGFHVGLPIAQVGLYRHPTIQNTHASPDGLVGDVGLVEIKCPQSSTHVKYMLTEKLPQKYVYQMLWQMEVCNRQWCDFVSYDPRMPLDLQLYVKRLDRDDEKIAELRAEVVKFLAEVDDMVAKLKEVRAA